MEIIPSDFSITSTRRYNVVYAGVTLPVGQYNDWDLHEMSIKINQYLTENRVYEVGDISLEFLPFSYTIEITPSWNKTANIERYP